MKANAMRCVLALALLALGAQFTEASAVKGDKTITKVVKLLQKMLDTSKTEGDEERKIYAKFKCYCDQNDAKKSENIEKNTQLISLLESNIEELQGSNGEKSAQCADLKADMAENKQQQREASGIRDKENKAFRGEKADLEQAIGQMKSALETLAAVGADQTKSTGADNKQFMAAPGASLLSLQSSVKDALAAAQAFMDDKQHETVASFMQGPFTGTYTSQSGAVLGIIKNMRDTFEANLEAAIANEKTQKESYDALMKVKRASFEEMSQLYDDAQKELGDNDNELSAKRGQLKDAEDEKSDDEEFLSKLRPMCKDKAESYDERKIMRANEEVAVAEAISILNSDAAFATFDGVDATSKGSEGLRFLQLAQKHFPGVSDEDVRQVMQRLLRRAANKNTPRIAHVISALQAGNPFDEVIDEIDKMIDVIGDEAEADKKNLNFCKQERKENKKARGEKKDEIRKLDTEIDKLTKRIGHPQTGLKAMIDNTEQGLEDNHNSQKSETTDRTEENGAYQKDIKNLVDAEELVENAIKVLKAYYDKFESLLQTRQATKEDPAAPETWGEYGGQSKQGGGAIGMLEFILKETKTEETEAHSKEEKGQADYEDSMTALKKDEAKKEKRLSDLQDKLATAEEDLLEAQENLKATEKDKAAIEDYLDKIRPGCDFITENFDLRETNRGTEKAALNTAKSTLKGSPAYKNAEADATVKSYGKCKEPCVENAAHVKCKACMADTSIPGYCAGHKNTAGC